MSPASPTDSVTALSHTHSNPRIAAKTVHDTVMAEQISHNVVENTESTSGSPLVDVAANQTTSAFADSGTHDTPLLQTKNDESLQTPNIANELATDANAITSSIASPDAPSQPEEGYTTALDGQTFAAPALLVSETTPADHLPLPNGMSEGLGHVDGLAEDASTREGSVDISLNSDTEGSRGDASEQKKDETHHVRTNSVKKPTTFSKVSVTKNFLAKSATPSPATVKAGDKPSPVGTPQQASLAKPRLIAKTGASLRDVQKARLGTEGASGPDASKVWNKNRRTLKLLHI